MLKLITKSSCDEGFACGEQFRKCGKRKKHNFKSHNVMTGLMLLILLSVFVTATGCSAETSDADVVSNPDEVAENIDVEKEPLVEAPIVESPDPPEASPAEGEDNTLGEKNAAKSAQNYISLMAFSYSGLVKQLEFEGYSAEEAAFGVDQTGADWNEQAALKALDYLSLTAFSYSGLVNQLEFEGFTNEEAVYGVDKSGADWNEQAAKKAQDYLDLSSFSRSELKSQLEFEGFTSQEAEYGVTAVGY